MQMLKIGEENKGLALGLEEVFFNGLDGCLDKIVFFEFGFR